MGDQTNIFHITKGYIQAAIVNQIVVMIKWSSTPDSTGEGI